MTRRDGTPFFQNTVPSYWDYETVRTLYPSPSYISSLYLNLLDRPAAQWEIDCWMHSGGSRMQIVDGFSWSYERRRNHINHYYRVFLHRTPASEEIIAWHQSGYDLRRLELEIASSEEAYGVEGGDPNRWVTSLYEKLLGRAPDSGGLSSWVDALSHGMSRSAVVRGFLFSKEMNHLVVSSFYQHFLNRGLDPGAEYWKVLIQNGAPWEQAIRGILTSQEYNSKN